DLFRSLKGVIPGANFTPSNGGDPTVAPSINVRGFNSINGGSPLILIDGIEDDIQNINPNDIESVTILKDAESSAIYGARGAFGVVLITTKKGEEDDFNVTYSNTSGLTTNSTRTDFITNPYEYAQIVEKGINAYNGGSYMRYNDEDWEIIKKVADGTIEPYHELQPDGTYKFYYHVDNYHAYFRKWRPQQSHNFSVSGGSKKLKAFASGRVFDLLKIENQQRSHMKRHNLN